MLSAHYFLGVFFVFKYVRNFSIIVYIDYGKSILADRMLVHTGAIIEREMKSQYLDSMDIEWERGIIIKSQIVRFMYEYTDG